MKQSIWNRGAGIVAQRSTLALLCAAPGAGCVQAECAQGQYDRGECRVVAENEVARLQTLEGSEVRFQDPRAQDGSTWDAKGLLREREPGVVYARVAGAGEFALSVDHGALGGAFELELHNVDPAAEVRLIDGPNEVVVPPAGGLIRRVVVPHPSPNTIWIRGARTCPDRYRIAALGDIQTNPVQFERIVEHLREEARVAESAGEPLVAMVVLGDLTESSEGHEFERIADAVDRLPVPAAITPGNHDVYAADRALYNLSFGPGNHAFQVCTSRVVLADTGDSYIAPSIQGRLPRLLDRGSAEYVLFGTHYPPHAGFTGGGWGDESQLAHVLSELALAGTDLLLAGHVHALRDFRGISVGDTELRQLISGTGGATQGAGVARYGYLRLDIGPEGIAPCFVEVPAPGTDGPANEPLSGALPYCE